MAAENTDSPPSALPDEGAQAAHPNELPVDLPIIDVWLCEYHPALWQHIRTIDDQLRAASQTPEDYERKLSILLDLYQHARALKAGQWRALLVRSEVLSGEEVWVVQDEEQAQAVQADGKAIYFADEFDVLKTKTAADIRDIHRAKLAFPVCRVVQ